MRSTVAGLAVLALVIAGAACGSGGGGSDGPPWGLDAIGLPDDVASVEAVFATMPDHVAGLDRVEARPNMADYEGDALVTVMRLGTPTEDMTATTALEELRLLSQAAKAGEIEMEVEELEGALVYIVFNTLGNGRHVYLASWGAPDSEFVFGVKAASPDERTALVQAFVEATSQG